jgi:hypothetical protein
MAHGIECGNKCPQATSPFAYLDLDETRLADRLVTTGPVTAKKKPQ